MLSLPRRHKYIVLYILILTFTLKKIILIDLKRDNDL